MPFQHTPNRIRLQDDIAFIELTNRRGEVVAEAVIDAADVDHLMAAPHWRLFGSPSGRRAGVHGWHRGQHRETTLGRFLLTPPAGTSIRHKNGDRLDFRRTNLSVVQGQSNAVRLEGHIAYLSLTDIRGNVVGEVIIDAVNLEHVQSVGARWRLSRCTSAAAAASHRGQPDRIAAQSPKGGWVELDRHILNAQQREIVVHLDGNIFNNRRANLEKVPIGKNKVRIEGETAYVELRGADRQRFVAEAMINVADVDKVLAFGRRWYALWAPSTSSYYVGSTGEGGCTVRLGRYLLDAPPETIVDHLNHDTLDHRRANLRICTQAENVQNRFPSAPAGIIWNEVLRMWLAYVRLKGHTQTLGLFTTIAEAASAMSVVWPPPPTLARRK